MGEYSTGGVAKILKRDMKISVNSFSSRPSKVNWLNFKKALVYSWIHLYHQLKRFTCEYWLMLHFSRLLQKQVLELHRSSSWDSGREFNFKGLKDLRNFFRRLALLSCNRFYSWWLNFHHTEETFKMSQEKRSKQKEKVGWSYW